jgi:hypothetical protein
MEIEQQEANTPTSSTIFAKKQVMSRYNLSDDVGWGNTAPHTRISSISNGCGLYKSQVGLQWANAQVMANIQHDVILCEDIHQNGHCVLPSRPRNILEDLDKFLAASKRGLKEHFLYKFTPFRSPRTATFNGGKETCKECEKCLDRNEI